MVNHQKAIHEIEKAGILLVFSIKNKPDPESLWSKLHPRSKMSWNWDEDGDDRVVNLWHLMKQLSGSQKVVYSKWYQNRATFFSKSIFADLLCYLMKTYDLHAGLIPEAREILEILEQDSPLSTKELKEAADLKGKFFESLYNNALKQLYQRGLIVSFGEKEDGAFPSSLMGSTRLLFEDVWKEAAQRDLKSAERNLRKLFDSSPALQKQLQRIEKTLKRRLA